jgi:metallo-beta-lactamase class B
LADNTQYDACIHPWGQAVAPFHIAGNLYYVGNRNVSSHLIDTGAGLILLDTAFPQTVYLLLESIRRLGFNPDDIAYIIHTHAHYDHMGGTRALVELTHARTAMGRPDVELMRDRPELTWTSEYGFDFHEAFDVDTPLEDGSVIELGSTVIWCMHTPGHTPGCTSFFFDVVENGQTRRVGIHGGPGLNTLSDAYLQQHSLPKSRRLDYVKSIERLRQEHVDIIIGAHPGQSHTFEKHAARTAKTNPFISPGDWGELLDKLDQWARDTFEIRD